jgi:hypothetical protein
VNSSANRASPQDKKRVSYIFLERGLQVSPIYHRRVTKAPRIIRRKYFDYFVFNIVDCGVNYGLSCSEARRRRTRANYRQRSGARHQLAPECGSSYSRPTISSTSERDNLNSARGLDNNFTSDRDCDSTTTTRLPRHHRLRRVNHGAPDKS